MKNILIAFSLFLAVPAMSQRIRILSGFDPANGMPGYPFRDTAKTPVATSPLIYDGDSTFSLGTVPVTKGGTGITSLTTGDIFYASGTNLLSRLPIGTNGQTLTVTSGLPSWSTVAAGGGGSGTVAGQVGQVAYFNGLSSVTSDSFFSYSGNILNIGKPRIEATQQSAILRLSSTTKGFLMPFMTTAQRDAIVAPENGLVIYNIDNNSFNVYTSTVWSTIASTANTVLTTTDQTVSGIKTFNGNGSGAAIMIGNNLALRGTSSTGGAIYIDANQSNDGTGTINMRGNVTFSSPPTATSFISNGTSGAAYTVFPNGAIRGASATNGTIYMDVSQDQTGTFNFRATTVNLPNAVATKYSVSALNSAPSSATATGTTGEIRWTSTAVYLCIATNTWVKATLATF